LKIIDKRRAVTKVENRERRLLCEGWAVSKNGSITETRPLPFLSPPPIPAVICRFLRVRRRRGGPLTPAPVQVNTIRGLTRVGGTIEYLYLIEVIKP
jgi:hypothetical protein